MSNNDQTASGAAAAAEAAAIAAAFVEARLRGVSVPAFPGTIPADLVAAYAVLPATRSTPRFTSRSKA